MPIHEGWNVLRFTRMEESKGKRIKGTLYDAFKFYAVNMATEEVEFVYLVPVGTKEHSILNDLRFMNVSKQWVDVRLHERNRIFQIMEMKEIKTAQQELDVMMQRQRGRIQ